MNYLDLLPDDVMKIINRKVEDLHIISRRKEKKINKKINREQKIIADHKQSIYNKYIWLYREYIRYDKLEHCRNMMKDIKKELGTAFIKAEPVVGFSHPYINVWIAVGYDVYLMKFYDFLTMKNIKMVHEEKMLPFKHHLFQCCQYCFHSYFFSGDENCCPRCGYGY